MGKLSDVRDEDPDSGRLQTSELQERIETMRSCGNFDWADHTLVGIGDTIAKMGWYSEGQLRAVKNVFESRHSDGWDRFEELMDR
jgi:hypothetical protein